ncbi:ATP synthase F1 subunit gamma [bacterium]|nr:ATP synthase F1 subunit gamma [Chloroflexi bacterium CFX6]RIL10120.1 MAG: ATP synthase F1 subunit gamma [bacterium]
MANTRDIRRRIKSIKNIGKVTRAMEAVSASKMRRAQDATLRSRAYAARAAEVLAHLRAQRGPGAQMHPLLAAHEEGKPAVVLVTPDRGLTGGLVLNIIRYAVQAAEKEYGKDLAWIAVGKKGRDFLTRTGADLRASFTAIPDAPSALEITPVARLVRDGFAKREFRAVHLVYADFVTVTKQRPTFNRLLPVLVPEDVPVMKADFDFEPSPEAVLDEVLPRLVEMQIYQAVLESQASEHAARMVAMRNATDAARDLVNELTLNLNKARQADITSEILDIAGGAEALRRAMAKTS